MIRIRQVPSYSLKSLTAGEAFADAVPVLNALFAKLPAELDQLAVPVGRKVDQALERAFELDAHPVQARHSFEQLELGAANRVARLLMPVAVVRGCSRSLRLVLGDSRLVLELGQQGGQLRDLGDDPPHSGQLVVCLVHGVSAEPLHGSTI